MPERAQVPLLGGVPQVRFVLNLLEQHPTLGMVVVSDSDAVWLRQPWPYFQQRPRADFFISTDCLSVQVGATGLRASNGRVTWRCHGGQC